MLPLHVYLLERMLTFFCIIDFEGIELFQCDFMKYTFNIGLYPDTSERILILWNTPLALGCVHYWMELFHTGYARHI